MTAIHTRIIGAFAALAALACLTLTSGTGAAWAAVDLSCGGWQTSHYSPGLRLEPRQVRFTATTLYGPCVGLSGGHITSGEANPSNTQTASCLLTNADLGRERIRWNTGEISVVQAELNIVQHPIGQTVVTTVGKVISGPFTGDKTVRVLTLVTPDALGCLHEPGVTSVSGPVSYTFTPLL